MIIRAMVFGLRILRFWLRLGPRPRGQELRGRAKVLGSALRSQGFGPGHKAKVLGLGPRGQGSRFRALKLKS